MKKANYPLSNSEQYSRGYEHASQIAAQIYLLRAPHNQEWANPSCYPHASNRGYWLSRRRREENKRWHQKGSNLWSIGSLLFIEAPYQLNPNGY